MPVRTSYAHGTPSWIDLSTTDPDGAQRFYGQLFGWEFTAEPTGGGSDYIMASKGGKSAAGMMEQAPEQAQMGVPSMWNTYVTVADIQETVGKVAGAGGSVMMEPMQVMDAGQMAVVSDPTGAVVCLWQAGNHIGSEVVNEHGALCWNECQTPDVATASKFYGELFGWGTDEMDMGPAGTYTVFTLGGDGVAGAMPPAMDGIPPHWGIAFSVDDCDGCVETARGAGATIVMEPMDIPVGRQAVITDPQGATFSVIKLAESPGG